MLKEDIATDVDYRALGFLESHLMHEKNRLGEVGVVEKYKDIDRWVSNEYEYNFLCGFISYYANRNNIKVNVTPKKLDKVVIEPIDYFTLEDGDLADEEIEHLEDNVIPEFLDVGILVVELGEAV